MLQNIITPMSPISHPHIFEDPNFIFQVKWDGVRMISYINNNEIKLINRRLNDRTIQYPELNVLLKIGHNVILDGEIITLVHGKPSFPTVMRRDGATKVGNIQLLKKTIPILYMLFDILYLDGQDLRKLPWLERNSILLNTVKPTENIHLVECFSEGTSLFAAIRSQELEGVVAKHKESPYVSGKKHHYWLKIKYRRQLSCVVGGYTLNNKLINSLLVGVYNDEQLMYCGRVGTGLKNTEWAILTKELANLEISDCPFIHFPPSQLNKVHFVKPYLTIEIEYAEWTPDIILRSPSIIGFSQKKPAECILS